jgi:hypothetical protein
MRDRRSNRRITPDRVRSIPTSGEWTFSGIPKLQRTTLEKSRAPRPKNAVRAGSGRSPGEPVRSWGASEHGKNRRISGRQTGGRVVGGRIPSQFGVSRRGGKGKALNTIGLTFGSVVVHAALR